MWHCSTLQHCRRFLLLLLILPTFAGLTGCGMGSMDTSVSGTFTLAGLVHGGNQPVNGATIQLYTAGTSGNGSSATPMITSTVVKTNQSGIFNITSDYNCVNSTDQVYITATGGNPGLPDPNTNNDGLVLIAALGNCGNLASISNIAINEVTTVAAVYALAPFIGSSYANIGATSTNVTGLANAFKDAALLVDTTTGNTVTYATGSGLAIQSGKLYALADAISYCVNSASSGSTPCASLATAATPTGGAKPAANTLATTLSIVQHPGDSNIVGAVWGLIDAQAPFTTTLTQAPNDWTMTLTISKGGLSTPTALGVDASGNVWVANYTGSLSAFSPQGTPFSSTGYGTSTLNESFGLAIDTSGNIWVTNYEVPAGHGSIVKFNGVGTNVTGAIGSLVTNTNNSSYYFYDSSIDFPTALAADTNGNIAIANSANSSASIYSSSSNSLVTSGLASGNSSTPVAIAFDSSHGLWLANQGDGTATHISSSGSLLAHPSCCDGADGVALDSSGNAWISNYSGSFVIATSSSGSSVATATGGGLSNSQPVGIAVDAAQNTWIADGNSGVITELAAATGNPISPSTGYGLDAKLSDPHGIGPDASGNLWVSDFANNTVVMFFGLAAPTRTPVQPIPTAP